MQQFYGHIMMKTLDVHVRYSTIKVLLKKQKILLGKETGVAGMYGNE